MSRLSAAPGGLPSPHHRLRVCLQLGALSLDVTAEFHAPWTVLFGPSGSGKSSLLRAMCGVLPPSGPSPKVEFARRAASGPWQTLENPQAKLSPAARAVAYAPQTAALFPHLLVRDNVRFGAAVASNKSTAAEPESQPGFTHGARPDSQSDDLGDRACELFELQPLWSRRPAELSGGERQRVNLARAFARPGARLLLLDEPFSGFDRDLRDRLLPRLKAAAMERALPVISVTHDVEEVFLLEANVMRLRAGRLLAQGPAEEVLRLQRSDLLKALRAPPA